MLFYMATCTSCLLPQPFSDPDERAVWAKAHAAGHLEPITGGPIGLVQDDPHVWLWLDYRQLPGTELNDDVKQLADLLAVIEVSPSIKADARGVHTWRNWQREAAILHSLGFRLPEPEPESGDNE